MKTRDKILLTIFLAVLAVWLFGCEKRPNREHYVSVPSVSSGEVNVSYLEGVYPSFNEGYFHNKLLKNPKIDMLEEMYMASTMCHEDGGCVIHFNPKYVLAPRTAQLVMLHEMCHIETWSTDVVTFGGKTEQADHGKVWRSCMLRLDMEGAFREIIIDNYGNEMP
jgi:hypothetical protein